MLEDIHHHLIHYVILLCILVAGFSTFLVFRHQTLIQMGISVVVAFLYVLWGIGHHSAIEKHMHSRIMIEYILVSLIGLILVWGVLGI